MISETIDYLLSNYAQWLYYLAIISIVFLVLSILFIPSLVARIPADYFLPNKRSFKSRPRTWLTYLSLLVRNIIGIILLLAGIAMLVLPGQGILTVLAGLFILDVPGKYKVERYLVQKPAILNSLNWLRRRRKVPEIRIH